MKLTKGLFFGVIVIVLVWLSITVLRLNEQTKEIEALKVVNEQAQEIKDLKIKTEGIVSVRDFGAKGDGVTDDTEAIRSALQYCLTNNKSLRIPGGKYIITELITVKGNGYFSIQGDGAETSLFYFSDSGAGISINFNDWHEGNVDVYGIGLYGNHSGKMENPLLSVTYINITNSSYNFKGPTFKNISSHAVKGSELTSAIKIKNAPHSVFDDLYLVGRGFKGVGILVDGQSVSTKYVNIWVHTFDVAVKIQGESEGGEFIGCNFVGNMTGLVYDTPETEPGGTIIGCHFNNTKYNIYANNRNSVFVSGTLFYATPDTNSDTTDIFITGKSSFWHISNNTFTTGDEAGFNEKGIELDSGTLYEINNNIFRQRDTGILIGESVDNSNITDNNIRGLLNQIINKSVDKSVNFRNSK